VRVNGQEGEGDIQPSLGGEDVMLEVLHHPEGAEAFLADDREQLFVADGELLVVGVVEVALLDDGPHLLYDLLSGHLVLAHDGSQLWRELAHLLETSLLSGHDE